MPPLPNGRNGRGQFCKGNPGGPGNPHARRVAELRSTLLRAVGPNDLRAVLKVLIEQAKGGDVAAIRELLDRLFGKQACVVELVEREESRLMHLERPPIEIDPEYARFVRGLLVDGE